MFHFRQVFLCTLCSVPHIENIQERSDDICRLVRNSLCLLDDIYEIIYTFRDFNKSTITGDILRLLKYLTDILWGVYIVIKSLIDRFSGEQSAYKLSFTYVRNGTYTLCRRMYIASQFIIRIRQLFTKICSLVRRRYLPTFIHWAKVIVYRVHRLLNIGVSSAGHGKISNND